jgi:leucyl-tRNA synthetase
MDTEMRQTRLNAKSLDEKKILEEAKEFYHRELKATVQVVREGDVNVYDPKGKAKFAEPYRPAIYIESEPVLNSIVQPSIHNVS